MDDPSDQDTIADHLGDLVGYMQDIPPDIARSAHRGTSFVPDKRADQERESYARQLVLDWAALEKLATTDNKREILATEFARYRAGYRQRYVARLAAMSSCLSTMITGGSGFNVRRAQKANARADKRTEDLIGWRAGAIARIRKALTPELQPIMAGDSDAVTRLDQQIAKHERTQALMAASNAAIRKHAKAGPEAQIAALVALGHPRGVAASLLEPDFCGRIGFADYQLKNNGANLRRLKARREQIARDKATPPEVIAIESSTAFAEQGADGAARYEDAPADNRVRLYFAGKPPAEVRSRLKAAGFRWAPSIGAWQAYRNHHSISVARREAGIAEVA